MVMILDFTVYLVEMVVCLLIWLQLLIVFHLLEILNVVFLWIHWCVVSFIVFFWFMDVGYTVGTSTPSSPEQTNFDWSKDKRGPKSVRREHNVFEMPVTRPIPTSPFDE